MPRNDATFSSRDVIRFFSQNLSPVEQRVVIGFFWSLIPGVSTEKKILGVLVDIAGIVPGLSEVVKFFLLIQELTGIIADLAELFGFNKIPEVDRGLLFALQDCEFLLSLTRFSLDEELVRNREVQDTLSELGEKIVDLDFELSIKESECLQRIRDAELRLEEELIHLEEEIRERETGRLELLNRLTTMRTFSLDTRDILVAIIRGDPTPLSILQDNPAAIPALYANSTTYREVLRAI